MRKWIKAAGALLALALLLSVTAAAFADMDLGRTGSITVSPTGGQSVGTSLTLYRTADVTAAGTGLQYALTDDFAGSGVDLANLDDAEALAGTLCAYAKQKGLSGTSGAAGTDGSVRFGGLKPGLYLVVQTVAQPGESIVNPFLVSVPMADGNGNWIYDVDASPKAETFELIDITVRKIWNDGGSVSSRPSSVTVQLYDGSALVSAATLNSKNNWTYTWTDLQKSDGYSVKETGAIGYAAAYSRSGNTFTVTNTPKLVQTGQLNWPVPVLAGCGMALFALGWGLVFLKGKNDA